jgi:hypothetical protein
MGSKANEGLFAVHKIIFEYEESINRIRMIVERIYAFMENTKRAFQRVLLLRQET